MSRGDQQRERSRGQVESFGRGVFERIVSLQIIQRALTSFRWRSGLNADLAALDARLEQVEREVLRDDSRTPSASALLETRGTTKAWATPADADLLEKILRRAAAGRSDVFRVLEWGSGLSTLYYPELLRRSGARVSWITVEHDRELFRGALELELRAHGASVVWSEELGELVVSWNPAREGTTAIVFDKGAVDPFSPNRAPCGELATRFTDYVTLPSTLDLRLDAVIVDGRMRRRCLLESADRLSEHGIALLHDAQRSHYHSAFGDFGPAARSVTRCGLDRKSTPTSLT